MAVRNSKNSRRIGLVAAALATVALPGMALAEPGEGRRGWGGQEDGGRVRQERSDDGRQARGWQQAPQQQSQAPQQRQPGWSQQAPAPQQRGWARPQPPQAPQQAPQQAQQQGWGRPQGDSGWRGGEHRGGEDRRGGEWNRDGRPPQQPQQQRTWGNQQGGWGDRDHRTDHDDRRGGWRPQARPQGGYYQGGYYRGESHGDRRWNHHWRNDRRYDWHSYRRSHPSYFNVGIYYAPYRNYSYRRLSIGFFLDRMFFGDRYWINDPWQYRLPEVYGPYRWVRYYDDAVLVDIYNGEVVDVIYDFFW